MFDRKGKKSGDSSSEPAARPPESNVRRTVMGGPPAKREGAPAPASAPAAVSPLPPEPVRKPEVPNATTIGSNVSVSGDVHFSGSLILNGEIKGSVSSDDRLVVGSSGVVLGELRVGVAEISGRVQGDVKASTSARLLRGANVDGDVESPTISIEEGALFQGRCTRPAESASEAGSSSSPAPSAERPQSPLRPVEAMSPTSSGA